MNLLLIGPQGSGKGTQAEKLVGQYHLRHLEMGDLIRKQSHQHSHKAAIIDHLANQKGQLLPDGIVLDLVIDYLEKNGYDNLLFDGFPRTVKQYQALKEILSAHPLNAAVYLQIPDDVAVKRLSARRICTQCSKSFSAIREPHRQTCDCGGKLHQRPDDQPKAIQRRLQAFHQSTQPILDILDQDGILIKVDGVGSIDEVFTRITQQLSTKL